MNQIIAGDATAAARTATATLGIASGGLAAGAYIPALDATIKLDDIANGAKLEILDRIAKEYRPLIYYTVEEERLSISDGSLTEAEATEVLELENLSKAIVDDEAFDSLNVDNQRWLVFKRSEAAREDLALLYAEIQKYVQQERANGKSNREIVQNAINSNSQSISSLNSQYESFQQNINFLLDTQKTETDLLNSIAAQGKQISSEMSGLSSLISGYDAKYQPSNRNLLTTFVPINICSRKEKS